MGHIDTRKIMANSIRCMQQNLWAERLTRFRKTSGINTGGIFATSPSPHDDQRTVGHKGEVCMFLDPFDLLID